MAPTKSSKKSKPKIKPLAGFKIYRDARGRFITKLAWQKLSKKKRGSQSVAVKRDAKGRFVKEKFLASKTKIVKEKVKKKSAVKKKKKKLKREICDYDGIFETPVPDVTGHYNVAGSRKLGNLLPDLSRHCLALLIEDQLKRNAVRFRIWYRMPSSPGYPTGIVSTEPFWYTKFQGEDGILGYLNRLLSPEHHVVYYWFRTKDFKQVREGDITLHGAPSINKRN